MSMRPFGCDPRPPDPDACRPGEPLSTFGHPSGNAQVGRGKPPVVTPAILPVEIQLLSLTVLLAFSAWVLWLIRTQRLHLRESLIWLLTTMAAIAVTAWPELLVRASRLVGVQVPANALFGAGLLYLALNVLAVTLGVSQNTTTLRRLAQECALLRAEVTELRARVEGRAPVPAPRPQEKAER
jgi:hypothetical protein